MSNPVETNMMSEVDNVVDGTETQETKKRKYPKAQTMHVMNVPNQAKKARAHNAYVVIEYSCISTPKKLNEQQTKRLEMRKAAGKHINKSKLYDYKVIGTHRHTLAGKTEDGKDILVGEYFTPEYVVTRKQPPAKIVVVNAPC